MPFQPGIGACYIHIVLRDEQLPCVPFTSKNYSVLFIPRLPEQQNSCQIAYR